MQIIKTDLDMKAFGRRLGQLVRGGEIFELVGDVGAGKTTWVKGLADGLGIDEDVQSPTFTINRTYTARDQLELHHYDFYRLADPGIVSYELAESVADPRAITVIEWAETVQDVLPPERMVMHLLYEATGEGRQVTMIVPERYNYLKEETV